MADPNTTTTPPPPHKRAKLTEGALATAAAAATAGEDSAGRVFAADAPPAALAAHFRTHGVVIVRALTPERCDALVEEQVREIFYKQPWTRRLDVDGLDIDCDRRALLDALTRPHLPEATRKAWRDCWPLHADFGACCDPNVFHLPGVWSVRQDPRLYAIATALLGGCPKLWVDVNRSIQRPPDTGKSEFLHWDLHYPSRPPPAALAGLDHFGGKVAYTASQFVCVPGTATPEFHAAFCAAYAPHYAIMANTKKGAKFGLDPTKPDPLALRARTAVLEVPAGCAIFWSPWLLHGIKAKPKDEAVEFGMYLGYMRAGARAEYQRVAKIDEREDRVRSYHEGRAPVLWPSLDPIHYYPARYRNFLKLLQPYVDKTRPDYAGLTCRIVMSGQFEGWLVPDLAPVPDPAHRPTPLTLLGKRLLGLAKWGADS